MDFISTLSHLEASSTLLACLYMQSQDLSNKSHEEIYDMFANAQYKFERIHEKEKLIKYWQ